MSNWIPGLIVVACVSTILPGVLLLGRWYDLRKSNVVPLPKREASNVVLLDAWRPGSYVRPLPQRRWGA